MTDLPPSPQPVFLPPAGARVGAGAPGPGDPPAFALPAAAWGQRAGALILDAIAIFAIAAAIGVLVYALAGDSGFVDRHEEDGETVEDKIPYWGVAGAVALIGGAFVYPWLLLGLWRGRTIGRRLVGIRVVNHDATPIRVGRAFLREGVTKGALSLFTLPLILSYLWPLWDPHQRALHDLVCSTRVVLDTGETDAFGGDPYVRAAAPAAGPTPIPRRGEDDRDDLAGRIGLDG